MTSRYKVIQALKLVVAEFFRAARKHAPYHSAHEGYAVVLEEMDELKAEVWKRERDAGAMLAEAVQVASSALRFVVDVCLKESVH